MKHYFVIILLFTLLGCKKEAPVPINDGSNHSDDPAMRTAAQTIFTIEAGKHESDRVYAFQRGHTMAFHTKFFSSCAYLNANPLNQGDINKLFGFTEGFMDVHTGSARFGWNYNPATQMINIFSYCYVNKVNYSQKIYEIPLETYLHCKVVRESNFYRFYINDVLVNSVGKNGGLPYLSLKCFPYFGGDETAPQTMQIELRP